MDLWQHALGFMRSQMLFTAVDLGVFEILAERPLTAGALARRVGLAPDPACRFLDALCAMELVEKQPDGTYVNATEAAERLVPGRPAYVGRIIPHLRDALYPVWRFLPDALREGCAQWQRAFHNAASPTEKMYEDGEALSGFLEGMHAITLEAATEFAASAPELTGLRSVTDVGGASGAFLIALARANHCLHGTVFDLPPVRPVAERHFAEAGLEDRLRFAPGDFWKDCVPAGSDAYSLGYILHDWSNDAGALILDKVAAACRPGGLLVIGEAVWNDDRTGPMWVAQSDMNMLVAAYGRERSVREYGSWIGEHGFNLERVHPTSRGKVFLLARRRQDGAAG